mmetsp:Transcript_15743/g.15209  ORF Transcript_15743/g.15209 Transcript_15743/m.15209 type:complete len:92 (+) Transcript_15743:471-746(+)
MVGGDNDFSKKLIYIEHIENSAMFEPKEHAQLLYNRYGHSACGIRQRYIMITGSLDSLGNNKAELYDSFSKNMVEMRNLNRGRSLHGSCFF